MMTYEQVDEVERKPAKQAFQTELTASANILR